MLEGPIRPEDPVRPRPFARAAAPRGRARQRAMGGDQLGRGARLARRPHTRAHRRVRRRNHRLRAGHRTRHEPMDEARRPRRRARAPQLGARQHLPRPHDGAVHRADGHAAHIRRLRLRSRRLHRVLGMQLRMDRSHVHVGPDRPQPRSRGEAHRHRPAVRASARCQGRPLRGRAPRFGHVPGIRLDQRHHERGAVRPHLRAEVHERAPAHHRGQQRAAHRGPRQRGRQPQDDARLGQAGRRIRQLARPRHRRGLGLLRHRHLSRWQRRAGEDRMAGPEGTRRRMDARKGRRDVLGQRRAHPRIGAHVRHREGCHH